MTQKKSFRRTKKFFETMNIKTVQPFGGLIHKYSKIKNA